MTIQEAIRSGKEFRRVGSALWLHVGMDDEKSFFSSSAKRVQLTTVDVLADDWELKFESYTFQGYPLNEVASRMLTDEYFRDLQLTRVKVTIEAAE